MRRLIALLPVAALMLTACSNVATDKQWYKPNVNYTAADFQRDSATCTDKKTKTLDDDCMKNLGWVALGGDIGPVAKPPDPTKGSKGSGKY